jgi:hypothetical protein
MYDYIFKILQRLACRFLDSASNYNGFILGSCFGRHLLEVGHSDRVKSGWLLEMKIVQIFANQFENERKCRKVWKRVRNVPFSR